MAESSSWRASLAASLALVLALMVASTSSVAVMSVDLGSEWMKVAVVTVRTTGYYGLISYDISYSPPLFLVSPGCPWRSP